MDSNFPVERLALMFCIWIQTSQQKTSSLTGDLQASLRAANQISGYLKLGHDCSRILFLIHYPTVIRHLKT
jgi:hypothetical protein